MEISLETIQNLAPDQASLHAAKKLLKPAKWPLLGQDPGVNTIWGQCQGSGSNPYLTMADVVDHGYKCTCPSRKFPCKHVLALWWQFADRPDDFTVSDPPEWVHDWLGRRRKKSTSTEAETAGKVEKKNILLATGDDTPALSAAEQANKEAAKAQRAKQIKAATEASIRDGLVEFQQWVDDQLRTGIGGLMKEISSRCRQIAARMVDAKAANLASRLDEIPAKVLALPSHEQARKVCQELSQLVWLSEAWLVDPDDPDARRSVAATESRAVLLETPETLSVMGVWETVGEQIVTRRDGLISHASWLLNLDESAEQRFALLQDFYPASVGRRQGGERVGSVISAELIFYPSRLPLRATIHTQKACAPQVCDWPHEEVAPDTGFARKLCTIPWLESHPFIVSEGRIAADKKGRFYWRDSYGAWPLMNEHVSPLLQGCEIRRACIVWDGNNAELLGVQAKPWGSIAC
ncbi:SWIM zinc finger family protein [Desulfogranum japonicum]|uniref:SWIM zinc finger family protein n=1 Tax=Desulfogranum japonicum TaxID=231447 RepID=UPI00041A9906|nr:SWIM zinc finger family protein [Desulfogranum japonicum]